MKQFIEVLWFRYPYISGTILLLGLVAILAKPITWAFKTQMKMDTIVWQWMWEFRFWIGGLILVLIFLFWILYFLEKKRNLDKKN